ncbi:MAG: DNA polymerase III subunit gamma/tau [Rhodoferax sp.]
MIDQVRIPPQIGKYKVYIIDEVHMLSTQAFNSFLKTLEEPPKHAIFILATTEKHKIIPTILSRCQVYDFNRINLTDIVEYLTYVAKEENITVEEEALNIIAQKADGGMRDALSIFDQTVSYTAGNVTYQAVIENLNVLDYEYYFKLTDAILQGNVVDSLLIINDILNHGFEGQHIISGMASHFRNLMISKDPRSAMLFEVGPTIKKRYIESAKQCSFDLIYEGGIANMNYSISNNAEYGEYVTGPEVINDQSRAAMHNALKRIQNGEYAKMFIQEGRLNYPSMTARRRNTADHSIEKVGSQLRAMMPWIAKNKLVDQTRN